MKATPANMERLRQAAQDPFGADGVVAYSPTTGEEYSASPGDYWDRPDDEPLWDSAGEPMILVRRVTTFEEVEA